MGRVGFGGLGLLQANPTPPLSGSRWGVGFKGLEVVSLKHCFGFRGALQFGGRISSLVLGLRGFHWSFRKSVGLALRSVWVSMDFFGALTARILPRTRDSMDPRKRADTAQRHSDARTDTRTRGRTRGRVDSRTHMDARTCGCAEMGTRGRADARTRGPADARTADARTRGRADPRTRGRADARTRVHADARTCGADAAT